MSSNTFQLPRNVIMYGLLIPMALLLGYLLTTPLDVQSLMGVGLVFALLLVPIFLRWHHVLLIVGWNAVMNAFFLPGQPRLWMVLVIASLSCSLLERFMNKNKRLMNVKWITLPLVALALVVIGTAMVRGGVGLRAFGSGQFGGRKYIEALVAIGGYFALTWQRIPPRKAALYTALFFLSGVTNVVSNIAYATGLYWLYWLFPVDTAVLQIVADYSVSDRAFNRLTGVGLAATSINLYILARHGVSGLFDMGGRWSFFPIQIRDGWSVSQPYRLVVFIVAFGVSLVGGFRSTPIMLGMIIIACLFLERFYRTRLFFALCGVAVVVALCVFPFTERLPMTIQRAISFLPVKVSTVVKYDTWASTDWRFRMWKVLLDEIPHYIWVGKGYGISPVDMYFTRESQRRGYITDYDASYIAGDYHSGPLSVLIPLGIWGAIAFLWFLGACLVALYRNWKYSPPELRHMNTFIFAYFVARTVFYFAFFGAFSSELFVFTGLIGLSVSLNGGVLSAKTAEAEAPAEAAPSRPDPKGIPPKRPYPQIGGPRPAQA